MRPIQIVSIHQGNSQVSYILGLPWEWRERDLNFQIIKRKCCEMLMNLFNWLQVSHLNLIWIMHLFASIWRASFDLSKWAIQIMCCLLDLIKYIFQMRMVFDSSFIRSFIFSFCRQLNANCICHINFFLPFRGFK